jgi:hypothetical protein
MEIPLFQMVFEEELKSLAVQLATLEPLAHDQFTVLKSQYLAIKNVFCMFEGMIHQGEEARNRLANGVEKTGIL